MTEATEKRPLAYYFQKNVVVMFFLGFSAGLPFPLVYSTLTGWLEDAGVDRSMIGMFAWLGFAYAFKFVWAPLVDSLRVPLLAKALGHRRSWLLVAQIGLLVSLMMLSNTDPAGALRVFTFTAVAVAFISATQDIVLDAYRIEIAPQEMQGVLAASYQYGYRMAILVGTAGALLLADIASWSVSYKVMALLVGVGMITTLLASEPTVVRETKDHSGDPPMKRLGYWFMESVAEPVLDFLRRYRLAAATMLVFIAVFRISDYVLGIMATPFYLDIGFSKSQIAAVAKIYGTVLSLVGIAGGGWAVLKFGAARSVIAATILIASTNLFFAVLASVGPSISMLTVTISADNFAMGFAGTVFIAYLSSLTNMSFTAFQYALFSSLSVFVGKLTAGWSGFVQEALGWVGFFLYAAAVGIPAIVLSFVVAGYARAEEQEAQEEST